MDLRALNGRRLLLGVTGGIAAYKAAELVRLFVKASAEVRVVMTAGAQQFITPLTMQALSQHPVATDTFDLTQEASIGHIKLADEAELLVIAPATADVIARLANGLANDLLTTVALATRAPVLLAPAMNVNMWRHPATQDNLVRLVGRGVLTVGPDVGGLACGWIGEGRMIEPADIAAAAAQALAPGDLDGKRVLVTAGPTWEPIDPVRFVGNRSTGKMGFAVAAAAGRRGAQVTLVAGPSSLATPPGVQRVDVETARQMREATFAALPGTHIVVMTAAVADYRPRDEAATKLKKETLGATPTVELVQNPDILAELRGRAPVVVGFAAETDDVERRAVAKRRSKGCDLLIANDVSEPGSGFGTDTNRVLIIGRDDSVEALPHLSKADVAERVLDRARAILPTEAKRLA